MHVGGSFKQIKPNKTSPQDPMLANQGPDMKLTSTVLGLPIMIVHAVVWAWNGCLASISQHPSCCPPSLPIRCSAVAHLLAVLWCSDCSSPLACSVLVFRCSELMVTSCYKFVSWHAQRKQWVAQVLKGRKRKALYQYFNSPGAAADAVKQFLGLARTAGMKALHNLWGPSEPWARRFPFFRWGEGGGGGGAQAWPPYGVHSCSFSASVLADVIAAMSFGVQEGFGAGVLGFHKLCKLPMSIQEVAEGPDKSEEDFTDSVQVHQLQTRSGSIPGAYSAEIVQVLCN